MTAQDNIIRKLVYQSCHRGCKETDILLGNFAKAKIHTFSDNQLANYQKLLEKPDADIVSWIMSREHPPRDICPNLVTDIINFTINAA